MQLERHRRFLPASLRAGIAGVLMFLVVGLGLLSVGQQLHSAWHHDAHSHEHHCAITLFAHGKVELCDAPIAAPLPTVICAERPLLSTKVCLLSADFLLLPGRAPPVFS